MPRPVKADKVRVLFQPPDGEPASIWVGLYATHTDGTRSYELLRDYGADLSLQVGWKAEAAGVRYEVVAVEGRRIVCAEIGGGS